MGNGSSPRVRGTARREHYGYRHSRFIPACAGNQDGVYVNKDREEAVHPRVCGEQPEIAGLFRP